MFSKFKPINDFVLVKVEEKKNTTDSGIFIPTEAQEKNQTAIVINAGKSLCLKEGDKVVYKKYMGIALDDTYLALKEEEVVGVL